MSHGIPSHSRSPKSPTIDNEVPVITLDSDSDSSDSDSDSDSDDDVVILEDSSPQVVKESKPSDLSLTRDHSRIQKLYNVFQLSEKEKKRRENEKREADRFIQMVGSLPHIAVSSDDQKVHTSFEESEEENEQEEASPWRRHSRNTIGSPRSDSDDLEEVAEDAISVDAVDDSLNDVNHALEGDEQLALDVHEFTDKFRKRKFILDKNQFFSTAKSDKDRAVLARLWHQLLGNSNKKCKHALERAKRWNSRNLPEDGDWNSESTTDDEHNNWVSRMDITLLGASLEEAKFEYKSLDEGYWNFELDEVDKEWRRYRKTIKELLDDYEQTDNSFFSYTHFTIRDVAEKKINEEQPEEGPTFKKFWIEGLEDLIEQNGKKKTKLVTTFLKRMKRSTTVKNALDINDAALRIITEELDKAFDENYHLPKGILFRQLILNVADIFFYDKFTKNWLIVHPKSWKLLDRIPVDVHEIKHLLNTATQHHS